MMTKYILKSEYADWMKNLVCDADDGYDKLLGFLDSVEFTYVIPMDGNRAEDGIDLRYRFAYETGYDPAYVASELDNRPCSVLEMMIALASRCEEHIMNDPDIGNRTGIWFWGMVDNLGLGGMTNDYFDTGHARRIITRFLNRDYERNGKGGLFTVKNTRYDMRTVEIWYQMCWYLDEILGGTE